VPSAESGGRFETIKDLVVQSIHPDTLNVLVEPKSGMKTTAFMRKEDLQNFERKT
jgi:hypothetical protein